MSAATSAAAVPNLIQFLESVPPPVTLLLVELAPVISRLRWAAEVVSWKAHWTDPWLTLAAWWAICLSANIVLRYLLPFGLLIPAIAPYLPLRHAKPPRDPPTTEHSISVSLSDLTTLQNLLPALPALPSVPFPTALRLSALLFPAYIILTYFVPMPILAGLAGTILLTYRAPWAHTARSVLWRSAYTRRFTLRVWSILSGSASPLAMSFSSASPSSSNQLQSPSASAPCSAPIRFLFTILECQRWWVGLDWTAALLPNERPSWCGVSHQPLPPPSAFSLPPPTSVFLATPNGKRVRRTATWRWEEGEWGVMVNKEGTEIHRVEKKPPGVDNEEGGAKMATRAASMLRERKASGGSSADTLHGKDERDSTTNDPGPGPGRDGGDELATDADGWVFCDNKWEGPSAKGGMGKYTRYRRWTRIAVLEETVEEVGPGEVGVIKGNKDQSERRAMSPERTGTMNHSRKGSDPQAGSADGEEGSSGLQQRLKAAAKG